MPELFDRDGAVEFDYDAIDRAEPARDAVAMAGEAFEKILDWIYRDGRAYKNGVLVRFHVFAWVTRPQRFNCATEAAMAKRLGISRRLFTREVSSFRDRFKFQNHLMNSEAERQLQRKIKVEWRKSDGGPVPIKRKP